MSEHYLDNAATTKVHPESAQRAYDVMTRLYGNPSSVHSMGIRAEELIDGARRTVSGALGCAPGELFFTSGGTEANNWAIFGAYELMRRRGNHIITTSVEHHSVLNAVKRLETAGARVTYLPVGPDGSLDFDAFAKALDEDTVLVSVMLVNNETGALFPVRRISDLMKARRSRALLHTDAVQGLLKVPSSVCGLGIDLLSVSAHKIHGPKGCGALFIRKGVRLPPLLFGGGQENGMRSGTENVPAIAAFGSACEVGLRDLDDHLGKLAALKEYAAARLSDTVGDGALILPETAAPHILSLSVPGIRSQVLVSFLESRSIFVSAGSACSRGRRSHVLEAMGLDPKRIDCSIRISFSRDNTPDDIDALCAALAEAQKRLR